MLLIISYILKLKPKQTQTSIFFFLTFFYKDLFCYKNFFKGHLSRSNDLFLVEPVLLLFLCDTSVGIRLPLTAYVEICINFDIENLKWHLLRLLICVAFKILTIFLPELPFFQNFFFTTGKWQTIKIMNLYHITLIFVLIILFLFFSLFWCIIIFGLLGY